MPWEHRVGTAWALGPPGFPGAWRGLPARRVEGDGQARVLSVQVSAGPPWGGHRGDEVFVLGRSWGPPPPQPTRTPASDSDFRRSFWPEGGKEVVLAHPRAGGQACRPGLSHLGLGDQALQCLGGGSRGVHLGPQAQHSLGPGPVHRKEASKAATTRGQQRRARPLTCLSHRLVSMIWLTSSWKGRRGGVGAGPGPGPGEASPAPHGHGHSHGPMPHGHSHGHGHGPTLTTFTSWDMDTSNWMMTASDTLATGRMISL